MLPSSLRAAAAALPADSLLEIVLDLGRIPQARLADRTVDLAPAAVSREDLDRVVRAVGAFGPG